MSRRYARQGSASFASVIRNVEALLVPASRPTSRFGLSLDVFTAVALPETILNARGSLASSTCSETSEPENDGPSTFTGFLAASTQVADNSSSARLNATL